MVGLSDLRMIMESLPETLYFSRWPIARSTVFYSTKASFAFTNLKPVIPGHVLVAPHRIVARLNELTSAEVADLFVTAELVGRLVQSEHPESDALTITVQDGKSAGQTVPHVHVHVMPRNPNDVFNARGKNDDIYEEINRAEKIRVDETHALLGRTRVEMTEEAEKLFNQAQKLLSQLE